MQNIDINQAQHNFQDLIKKTMSGGVIIITQSGQPIAKIVPISKTKGQRQFGKAKDLIKIADDFDKPLDDFKDYM